MSTCGAGKAQSWQGKACKQSKAERGKPPHLVAARHAYKDARRACLHLRVVQLHRLLVVSLVLRSDVVANLPFLLAHGLPLLGHFARQVLRHVRVRCVQPACNVVAAGRAFIAAVGLAVCLAGRWRSRKTRYALRGRFGALRSFLRRCCERARSGRVRSQARTKTAGRRRRAPWALWQRGRRRPRRPPGIPTASQACACRSATAARRALMSTGG